MMLQNESLCAVLKDNPLVKSSMMKSWTAEHGNLMTGH